MPYLKQELTSVPWEHGAYCHRWLAPIASITAILRLGSVDVSLSHSAFMEGSEQGAAMQEC